MRVGLARFVIALSGLCLVTFGYGFQLVADTEVVGAALWPAMFYAIGGLTLLFAAFLNKPLYLVTGFCVPVSFLVRTYGALARYYHDPPLIDGGRAVSAAALYAFLTIVTTVTWLYGFGPVMTWYQQHRARIVR